MSLEQVSILFHPSISYVQPRLALTCKVYFARFSRQRQQQALNHEIRKALCYFPEFGSGFWKQVFHDRWYINNRLDHINDIKCWHFRDEHFLEWFQMVKTNPQWMGNTDRVFFYWQHRRDTRDNRDYDTDDEIACISDSSLEDYYFDFIVLAGT